MPVPSATGPTGASDDCSLRMTAQHPSEMAPARPVHQDGFASRLALSKRRCPAAGTRVGNHRFGIMLGILCLVMAALAAAGCGSGIGGGSPIPAGTYTGSWSLIDTPAGASSPFGDITVTVDSSGRVVGSLTAAIGDFQGTGTTGSVSGTVDGSGNVNLSLSWSFGGDTAKGSVQHRSNGSYSGTLNVTSNGTQVNQMSLSVTRQ
jgi:hypothetical protein